MEVLLQFTLLEPCGQMQMTGCFKCIFISSKWVGPESFTRVDVKVWLAAGLLELLPSEWSFSWIVCEDFI